MRFPRLFSDSGSQAFRALKGGPATRASITLGAAAFG
jgi:hypothetical protein